MPIYRMIVEYDGTRFRGFQRQFSLSSLSSSPPTADNNSNNKKQSPKTTTGQLLSSIKNKKRPRLDPNGSRQALDNTIQECIEYAICHWLDTTSLPSSSTTTSTSASVSDKIQQLNLKYAGRTDKGVHARGQVIVVTLPMSTTLPYNNDDNNNSSSTNKAGNLITYNNILQSINSRLPIDISITSIIELHENNKSFDPRHDAKMKEYSYTIKYRRYRRPTSRCTDQTRTASEKLGIETFRNALDDTPCLWLCPWLIDDSIIPYICKQIQGKHNFTNFIHKDDRDKYKSNFMILNELDFQIIKETKHNTTPYHKKNNTNSSNVHNNQDTDDTIVVAKFIAQAKGFRRSMVRNLVGFVINVARNELFAFHDIYDGIDVATNNNASKTTAIKTKTPPPISQEQKQQQPKKIICWDDIWDDNDNNNDNNINDKIKEDGDEGIIYTNNNNRKNKNEISHSNKNLTDTIGVNISKSMVNAAPASGLCLEWVQY